MHWRKAAIITLAAVVLLFKYELIAVRSTFVRLRPATDAGGTAFVLGMPGHRDRGAGLSEWNSISGLTDGRLPARGRSIGQTGLPRGSLLSADRASRFQQSEVLVGGPRFQPLFGMCLNSDGGIESVPAPFLKMQTRTGL
jgi:hypothetical protein